MRRLLAGLSLVVGLGILGIGVALPATATGTPPPDNPNEYVYWCGANGVKFDPVNTPFIVPPPPAGQVWTLLVLKAGSEESTPNPYNEIVNPVVGMAYYHDSGKTISHAILCYGPTTTTVPVTNPNTLPTTTVPPTTTTVCDGLQDLTYQSTTTTNPCATTTTLPPTTTTTTLATTTTSPQVSLFAVGTFAFCGTDNLPEISITFGNRPDLTGQTGTLFFSDLTSMPLLFTSGATVTFPYPASHATPLLLIYVLNGEVATALVTLPADCPPVTTTTTTLPGTTTTLPGTTTTAGSTTTTAGSTTTVTGCPTCTVPTTLATTTTAGSTTVATTAATTTVATTAPPTSAAAATTTAALAPPTTSTLPVTGTNTAPLIWIGLGLTGAGTLGLLAERRRKVA